MNDQINRLRAALPAHPDIAGREDGKSFGVMALLACIGGELSFIFEKRAKHIRQGGEVCFPGGMFEEDVDVSTGNTALRETAEELGDAQVEVIGRWDTIAAHMGAVIDTYVGFSGATSLDEFRIDTGEVEKVFAVPVRELLAAEPEKYKLRLEVHPHYTDENGREIVTFPAKDLGLPEIYHGSWGNFFTDVYLYRAGGEVIWGITARIVYGLLKLLR